MGYLAFFVLCFCVVNFNAQAQNMDSPTTGAINSVTEGDIGDHIDYVCNRQQDSLHCHFEQNIIMSVDGSLATCEIKHNSFDEDYDLKAGGLWTRSTTPNRMYCGMVDFSSFQKESTPQGKTDWVYVTQQVYTQEDGVYGLTSASCKKVKESGAEKQMTYKPSTKPEFLWCLFIKH